MLYTMDGKSFHVGETLLPSDRMTSSGGPGGHYSEHNSTDDTDG